MYIRIRDTIIVINGLIKTLVLNNYWSLKCFVVRLLTTADWLLVEIFLQKKETQRLDK